MALRMPGWVRVPRHQDASATLEEAYPFMVEGSLRSDGMFVGQDLYSGGSVFYTPWVLCTLWIITAPNLVLARIVGSGKSSLAKSLYTRSLPFGHRVYLFGDPKGEHTAMAKVMGGKALELGHGLHTRLNTLDEGHRPGGFTDQERGTTVTSLRRDLIGALAETVSVRGLTPLEHTVNNLALTAMATENEVPILPMVVDRISTPTSAPWTASTSAPPTPEDMSLTKSRSSYRASTRTTQSGLDQSRRSRRSSPSTNCAQVHPPRTHQYFLTLKRLRGRRQEQSCAHSKVN